MTLSDQPEAGVSAPFTEKPSVDPLAGSPVADATGDSRETASSAADEATSADEAIAADQAAGAAAVISSVAPYDPSQTLDTLVETEGGTALGLSPGQARLVGLTAALLAAAGGALFVRNRLRKRRRATAKERLQDRLYLSVSRLIAATMFTVGPLHDRQQPVVARFSPLVVEAILRRKTGATPLLFARASQALPSRKRH